jgi:hypothetical protein
MKRSSLADVRPECEGPPPPAENDSHRDHFLNGRAVHTVRADKAK